MARIRFSISHLLCLVGFLGLALAGLRSGSNDWFKSLYTLTFITLLYGAIAAQYPGAFWYGFAVVGWAYFLIGFGPWIGPSPGPGAVNRDLVTSVIEEIVSGMLPASVPTRVSDMQVWTMMRDLREANRNGICHSALTILFGIAGGLVARRLESRARCAQQPRSV